MSEEWKYLHGRYFDLRHRVISNRLYQQERQSRLESREGVVKVFSLASGTAALAKIADPMVVSVAASIIFIGTAASLVFSWGNKARDAAKRSTEWAALEKDIDHVGARNFTEQQVNEWLSSCSSIENGEPAPNRALFNICSERATRILRGTFNSKPTPGWHFIIFIP